MRELTPSMSQPEGKGTRRSVRISDVHYPRFTPDTRDRPIYTREGESEVGGTPTICMPPITRLMASEYINSHLPFVGRETTS
jgi:hypothetical protein